jgi:hypothetical protein
MRILFKIFRGEDTMGRSLVVGMCVMMMAFPLPCFAASPEVYDSSYWSNLVHEENSVTASVLYLPYLFLMIPYRMVDGIANPKPASQSVVPPPVHRAH